MKNNGKTHFIFDFDDTISSSYEHNQEMFYQTFLPHVADIDEKFVRKIHKENRGTALDFQFKIVVDGLKLNLDPKKLMKENEALHVKHFREISLFEGIHEFFGKLKEKGKKISICTNRQYGSLKEIIKSHKIGKYFENVVSCKDEGHEKPDPQCILDIINKYDEPKENYIYFGDSKTDFDFATNAGIDFVIIDHYINEKNFYRMIVNAFLT